MRESWSTLKSIFWCIKGRPWTWNDLFLQNSFCLVFSGQVRCLLPSWGQFETFGYKWLQGTTKGDIVMTLPPPLPDLFPPFHRIIWATSHRLERRHFLCFVREKEAGTRQSLSALQHGGICLVTISIQTFPPSTRLSAILTGCCHVSFQWLHFPCGHHHSSLARWHKLNPLLIRCSASLRAELRSIYWFKLCKSRLEARCLREHEDQMLTGRQGCTITAKKITGYSYFTKYCDHNYWSQELVLHFCTLAYIFCFLKLK